MSRSQSPKLNVSSDQNIPFLDKWFATKSYFLEQPYQLPGFEPFEVFTFHHDDNDVKEEVGDDGLNRVIFDLQGRIWKFSQNDLYYIQRVELCSALGELQVLFLRRCVKLDTITTSDVSMTMLLSREIMPEAMISQDCMPRLETLERFKTFKDKSGIDMPPTHVQKFFNAFVYMLINETYTANPEASNQTGRKPIPEARYKRMWNAMLMTWDAYPDFAKRYSKSPPPICIADQRFDGDENPENAHGIMILRLYLNRLPQDYIPVLRFAGSLMSLEEVEKLLSSGSDPIEVILKQFPVEVRQEWSLALPLHEDFRW